MWPPGAAFLLSESGAGQRSFVWAGNRPVVVVRTEKPTSAKLTFVALARR